MAEAALAAVGSAASVIQLGDAALRLCRTISSFIGELKDANDDIKHLQYTLDDTSSLMRNLVIYIREFQSVASACAEHEVIPDVVIHTVQQFHEILGSLRECLPPDLSPSFAQKLRFVFDKKKVKVTMVRLEECKTSALLALNIITGRNGFKLRKDLSSLMVNSERIAAEQRTAAQASFDQESQLMTAIQDVSYQQSLTFPTVEQVDRRTLDIAAQLQAIYSIMATQKPNSRRLHSTKTFTAIDEDSLAKLVRICITQTLGAVAPGMDKDMTSRVADLSTGVASQAHRERFFSATMDATTQTSAPISEGTGPVGLGFDTTKLPQRSPTQSQHQPKKLRTAQLFRTTGRMHSRLAIIALYIIGVRGRQTDSCDSASYFSIKIDVIPRHFMSRGISLSYTNSPDDAGYYNICPRILTFTTIPSSAPVWRVLEHDEADSLRRMIISCEVGVRDVNESGFTLFDWALRHASVKCCRYLLNGTGISKLVIFNPDEPPNVAHFLSEVSLCTFIIEKLAMERLRDLRLLAIECGLKPDPVEPGCASVWSADCLWWRRQWRESPVCNREIQMIRVFQQSGLKCEPLSWIFQRFPPKVQGEFDYAKRLHECGFRLELCLKTGGNPNDASDAKEVPLELAIEYSATILAIPNEKLKEMTKDTDGDAGNQKHRAALRILILLIDAGADIFYIREVNGQLRSIIDFASEKGVIELWEEALRKCGRNPKEVYRECEQRRAMHKRLCSAERSGVDVGSIKNLSTSGLRHRAITAHRTNYIL